MSETATKTAPARLLNLHGIDTPVGAKGTTVRLGRKWYDADCSGGIELVVQKDIQDPGTVVGHAKLFYRTLLNLSLVTDEMLEDEHEEAARTKAGLIESLNRAYGVVKGSDLVTVLSYWRTD